MKLFLLVAASAALTFAQEAKVAPEKAPLAPTPKEIIFTAEEIEKLTLVGAQLEVLQGRFKVDELEAKFKEFQAAIAPIAAKQQAILNAKCGELGLTEENIKAGKCMFSLGVDSTGKVIKGQDGKPLASRVWVAEGLQLPAADKK